MTSSSENKITIVILGDGGTGKSCITMRLLRSKWIDEYDPTIEDSYSTQRQVDGVEYRLDIIDTAGQEEYRDMLGSLFLSQSNIDAYLMVYDITSAASLENLEYFDELIEKNAEFATASAVKMVAANKCDLEDHRAIPSTAGIEWARKHGCGFLETSAKNMINIEEIFEMIVRQVALKKGNVVGTTAGAAGAADASNSSTNPRSPSHQPSRANLRQAFSSANLRKEKHAVQTSETPQKKSSKGSCCCVM